MRRFYGNAAQRSAPYGANGKSARAGRDERARADAVARAPAAEEAKRWRRAEGPLPVDVWKEGTLIASYAFNADMVPTVHVLQHGEGFYLQSTDGVGWRFYVAAQVTL
jgi:hypothetical protein